MLHFKIFAASLPMCGRYGVESIVHIRSKVPRAWMTLVNHVVKSPWSLGQRLSVNRVLSESCLKKVLKVAGIGHYIAARDAADEELVRITQGRDIQ